MPPRALALNGQVKLVRKPHTTNSTTCRCCLPKNTLPRQPGFWPVSGTVHRSAGRSLWSWRFLSRQPAVQSNFRSPGKTQRNRVLSNPKISAVNGQEANIVVGTKVIYPGGADQPPKKIPVSNSRSPRASMTTVAIAVTFMNLKYPFVESWSNNNILAPVIGTRSAKTTVRVRERRRNPHRRPDQR